MVSCFSTEREFSQPPRHHRSDDDGGFRSEPRPVSLPLHSRSPYSDDWGSAPSSDNSEQIQSSPQVPTGQGSYPRHWQQPQQQQQQQRPQQLQQQQQQQPQQQQQSQRQPSEPMNKHHIPGLSNPDPAFKHNGDVQRRSTRNPATVDPHYARGPSSPPRDFKSDPRYPDQTSMHHPGYPGPAYRDGNQPQQRQQPHPDQRYFPDPRYQQQNSQRRMEQTSPRSVQQSMPGSGNWDRDGGFTGASPRAPMGQMDRQAPLQQQGSHPRHVRGNLGSPRMQQDDRTPQRMMNNDSRGSGQDRAYSGHAKQPRQDDWPNHEPAITQSDWLSQNLDPAGRRQNRNSAQPVGQYPERPSASLPNHYNKTAIPTDAKHNTFDTRSRRDDLRPLGGNVKAPYSQANQPHTNQSPVSDGSSSYSSRSNQGRGKEPVKKSLFGDKPPGGSMHQSPRIQPSGQQQPLSSRGDPRRYFEPLTIQTGPIYENLNQMPPQITVSDVTPAETPTSPLRESPTRPPLPAALRNEYIRELAKSRSPHTREDMLNASQLAARRQHEPLIFRYPTTNSQV